MNNISLEDKFRRKRYSEDSSPESDERLRQSLHFIGMREPLWVVTENGRYILVDGYRRYTAIEELKRTQDLHSSIDLEALPCIVISDNKLTPVTARLQSDVRQDLPVTLQAEIYRNLINKPYKMRRKDIAKICGVTVPTIYHYLAILDCIEPVRKAIEKGKIPMTAARDISPLTEEGQKNLYGEIKSSNSVQRTTIRNITKNLNDSFFKRPRKQRMRITRYLREKSNQRTGGIKKKLLFQDLSTEEIELKVIKQEYEKSKFESDSIIGWFAVVFRNEQIVSFLQTEYPQEYEEIAFLLEDEVGIKRK